MNTQQSLDHLMPVLDRLANVADGVSEQQLTDPTPCSDFTVDALLGHTVSWLENFAAGFASPDGNCPRSGLQDARVPLAEAGERIRAAGCQLKEAIDDGAATRELRIAGDGLPGDMALSMILGEYLVHGWDLAVATGQEWDPDEDATRQAHDFLTGMVTPESRGGDGMFGPEVEVPADASALDQLLGFTGRDPQWRP